MGPERILLLLTDVNLTRITGEPTGAFAKFVNRRLPVFAPLFGLLALFDTGLAIAAALAHNVQMTVVGALLALMFAMNAGIWWRVAKRARQTQPRQNH